MPVTKSLEKIIKTKRLPRNCGQPPEKDQRLSEKLYTQGPVAYGNIENLMAASELSKNEVEFSWLEETLTQSTALREKKFPD